MTIEQNCWYINGLCFQCQKCGRCCSGPAEGYIWVSSREIEIIAEYLGMKLENFKNKYVKRVGIRQSLIEEPATNDCIFLRMDNGRKYCSIYSVRPMQCRKWPFWSNNLRSPDDWNRAASLCPGINRGDRCSYEQIEAIRNMKKWWVVDPNVSR